MSYVGHQQPVTGLSCATRDMDRAIFSLMEELDAVYHYHQRAEACVDSGLRAIAEHHRDQEIAHAAMLLEWIRRKDPGFSMEPKSYLFADQATFDQ